MNKRTLGSLKKRLRQVFAALVMGAIGMVLGACGVKGKPLPPLEPPVIGNGTPEALVKKDEKKPSPKR